MNGAEAPENRVRVLRRALMYFGGGRAARDQVSVHLAVSRPTRILGATAGLLAGNPPPFHRR